MKLNRFNYLMAQGVKNIFTHGFMSFASITIIIACLLIMGSFSLLTLNIDANIDRLQNQNEVIAYVDETLTEDGPGHRAQGRCGGECRLGRVRHARAGHADVRGRV